METTHTVKTIENLLEQDMRRYQPIPFWSWNDKLEKDELCRQIRHMQSVGIGGFIMHARGGLITEYLSEDWFEAVSVCIDEAEKLGMNAWCYDENGWPSGFAGMKLLEDEKNHAHYLTCEPKPYFDSAALAVYTLMDESLKRVHGDTGAAQYICVYDNTNSSVVDILNPAVVKQFLCLTHEEYYTRFSNEFGKNLIGFFTDEPQYFRWDTAYSPMLCAEYEKEYGEDMLERLGALFIDCDGAYEFRHRYWTLMNRQYTETFAKQVYEWLDDRRAMLTGHSIEESRLFSQMWCCAGVMPFYEYQHIPGIDWLGREINTELSPRQVGSVAQQLGKKQVLSETFACCGWDVTPKELKRIAEWQYVNGVNLMCHHLYPYSIRGHRKRDYPAFFSEHNPWIRSFKHFNDYFTTLGYLLAESREEARVAVIHPIHSAYLTYDRSEDYLSIKLLEDRFHELIERLGAANVGHHYVDESLLRKHGRVEGAALRVGLCEYDIVIIPDMQGLDASTVDFLRKYVDNSGKLYLAGQRPQYVDGRRADLDFLQSNIAFSDIANKGYAISDPNTEIRSTFRHSDFGDFLYTVNLSKTQTYDVEFQVAAQGVALFDLQSQQRLSLYYKQSEYGVVVPLHFKPGQSYLILLDDDALPSLPPVPICEEISVSVHDMQIVHCTENAITLDYAAYSYDGEHFSKSIPVMALDEELLKARENREVYVKYEFFVDQLPQTLYLESERMNAVEVWLNSQKISMDKQGRLDKSFVRCDIRELVRLGHNEVVFRIDYFQNEHVYQVLFDKTEGTESLLNCLTYDTNIESVYLLGNFSVATQEGFVDGEKDTWISPGKFAVTGALERIDAGNITVSGFPFFAGTLTLETYFDVEHTDYVLELAGRFAVAEIRINDEYAGDLMFDYVCDIRRFLKLGRNKLTICLTNSNRNLLGPFHCAEDDEPYSVMPDTFERRGSWQDGESVAYRHSYSFMRFGIDGIWLKRTAET